MEIPRPNEVDVKAFQELYLRKFGMNLSEDEAWKVARQVIGIVYVQKHYPTPPDEDPDEEPYIDSIEPPKKTGKVDSLSRIPKELPK